MAPSLKIAIIGAGPAGCTLARLLHNASIPVTIFEGETSIDARSQGGTLDLHPATGLKALKEAGLYDDFLKYARFDGEAFALADKNLKKYISMKGTTAETSRGRPEIDRAQLRQIQVESLPSGTVQWGRRLRSIDDDLSMHFDHGVEKDYDLIVGADGAWSKVRPVLSKVKPIYTGVGGLEVGISDVEKRYPELHKLANRGSLFAFSDSKSIGAQQKGDGSLSVHVWSARDEDWMKTCGYNVHDSKEAKNAALKEYQDWAEPLKKIIEAADEDDIVPRSLYELPAGHRWESRPGVTLIGDAAHLSSPFAGEGVNVAMEDALKLSYVIIAATKELNPVQALHTRLKAFEEDMFRRGTAVQQDARFSMELMYFWPGAPATTIDRYVRQRLVQGWKSYLLPLWVVRIIIKVITFLNR